MIFPLNSDSEVTDVTVMVSQQKVISPEKTFAYNIKNLRGKNCHIIFEYTSRPFFFLWSINYFDRHPNLCYV